MPRIRKTVLAMLMAALVMTGMVAAADVKIGFLVKQPEEPWFQVEWKFGAKAAEDLGFDIIQIGTPDGEKVLNAIDNITAAGAQGFVICTPDVRLGPGIMAKARANNLKVVTVDDRFIGADGNAMAEVPYIGMSATNFGRQMGEALMTELKTRNWDMSQVGAMITTFDELDTTRERTEGAIAQLKEMGFPEGQIYKAPIQQRMEIPTALDAANTLLTRYPDVKYWIVGGPNDNSVLGAVRALEGRGFTAETAIAVGINGTDCIDELAKATPTPFFGSILGLAGVEGYEACKMLYYWIKDGKEPPLDTRTAGRLITRANFRQVLKEEGMD